MPSHIQAPTVPKTAALTGWLWRRTTPPCRRPWSRSCAEAGLDLWLRHAVISAITVVAACANPESPSGSAERSSASVSAYIDVRDGAHGGNPHFYFLPPLAPDPRVVSGIFDPTFEPTVEVCRLEGAACEQGTTEQFSTAGTGSEVVRMVQADQLYIVNWRPRIERSSTSRYRIVVFVGGQELGRADILPRSGTTFPIKFRIEQGAAHLARFVLDPGLPPVLRNRLFRVVSFTGSVPAGTTGIALPVANRPSIVFVLDNAGKVVLLGFPQAPLPSASSPGSPETFTPINAESTTLGMVKLLLIVAARATPEMDNAIRAHPLFPEIRSSVARELAAGNSPLSSGPIWDEATALAATLVSKSTPALLASTASLGASASEIFLDPLTVRDGTGTSYVVAHSTSIYWTVWSTAEYVGTIDEALLHPIECLICGEKSVVLGGINGTALVHASGWTQDAVARNVTEGVTLVVSGLLQLAGFDLEGVSGGVVELIVAGFLDPNFIANVAEAFESEGAKGVFDELWQWATPEVLISIAEKVFERVFEAGITSNVSLATVMAFLAKQIPLVEIVQVAYAGLPAAFFVGRWLYGSEERMVEICQVGGRIQQSISECRDTVGPTLDDFSITPSQLYPVWGEANTRVGAHAEDPSGVREITVWLQLRGGPAWMRQFCVMEFPTLPHEVASSCEIVWQEGIGSPGPTGYWDVVAVDMIDGVGNGSSEIPSGNVLINDLDGPTLDATISPSVIRRSTAVPVEVEITLSGADPAGVYSIDSYLEATVVDAQGIEWHFRQPGCSVGRHVDPTFTLVALGSWTCTAYLGGFPAGPLQEGTYRVFLQGSDGGGIGTLWKPSSATLRVEP